MVGLLVAATVTASAGTAAWLVPIGIEASYEEKNCIRMILSKKRM